MKVSSLKKFIYVLAVVLFTALPAFCAPISVKQTALKFILAMGGVALSSFLIFAGLSLYNKLFVAKNSVEYDDDLSTPDNVDDAIVFFIRKNKL